MKNNDRLPSLDKLQAKIDRIRGKNQDTPDSASDDMSYAVRLTTDLAAGVIMGVGIGYLIDLFFSTIPLFMILGLFLGGAAGVKNMMRSAKIIDKKLSEQRTDNDNI